MGTKWSIQPLEPFPNTVDSIIYNAWLYNEVIYHLLYLTYILEEAYCNKNIQADP